MIIFCQSHTKCSSHWCHIITNIMVKYHVLSIWLYSFLCNILAIKRYYQYVPHSLCFCLSQGFELQIQVITQSGFAVFYSWNITNNNLITFIFAHETWCLTRTPKKSGRVTQPCLLMSCHQRFGSHQENKTSQCFHKKTCGFKWLNVRDDNIILNLVYFAHYTYLNVDKKSFDKLTIGKQLYLLIGKWM